MKPILQGTVIGAIIVFVVCITTMTDVIGRTADHVMRSECYKWQGYERNYEGFELNARDTATCALLGVTVK